MVKHRGSVTMQQRSGSIFVPAAGRPPAALIVDAGSKNNVKIEPWKAIRSADSPATNVGGVGAGTWISPTGALRGSICPAVDGGIAFCIAPTFTAPPPQQSAAGGTGGGPSSPKFRSNSCLRTQRLVLAYRDKESLIEEVKDLRKTLREQADYFRVHKVHVSTIDLENRKLEKDIEELEMLGLEGAPRTGSLSRLRARLCGLKTRLHDLRNTYEAQLDELTLLRKDIRVTRTREVKIERDIFAEEIGRLQRLIEHLKMLRDYVINENKKLSRVKDKCIRLEIANQHLEGCIAVVQESLKKANAKIEIFKAKTKEYQAAGTTDGDKCRVLQEQADRLEADLGKERLERMASEKRVNYLRRRLWRAEHDLAELEPMYGKVDGSCQVNYLRRSLSPSKSRTSSPAKSRGSSPAKSRVSTPTKSRASTPTKSGASTPTKSSGASSESSTPTKSPKSPKSK